MADKDDHEPSADSSLTSAYRDEVARQSDFSVDESSGDTTTTEQVVRDNAKTSHSVNIPGHRIVKLLGRGGMGSVFEAIELSLGRRVAVKTLLADPTLDKQLIRRFEIETRAVAQLDHDNIVRIYQVGNNHDVYYYTMQLIEGPNLATVIADIKDRNKATPKSAEQETPRRGLSKTKTEKSEDLPGHTPVRGGSSESKRLRVSELVQAFSSRRSGSTPQSFYKTVALLVSEIAFALAHAHEQGVIHRDIKPSNILIDEAGKPWVTDFGLAMVLDNPVATRPGDVVGTYRYMSPEQASGRRFLIDHRTDIYSLGVTLYEMVTLNAPFTALNPRDLLRQVSFEDPKSARSFNPSVPEELEIIISKSMAKNPQDRFTTARELADDLRRFANDQPILAKRASIVKRTRRWIGMHQSLVATAVCVILLLAVSSFTALGFVWSALVREHSMLVQVENERDFAEGRRLLALSGQNLRSNPGLSLLLANEGASLAPGSESNKALLDSLTATHERKTRFLDGMVVGSLNVSRDGRLVVATFLPDPKKSTQPAMIFDVASANLVKVLSDRVGIADAVFAPSGSAVLTVGKQTLKQEDANKATGRTEIEHQKTNALLWNIATEQPSIVLTDATPEKLDSSAFSADGRWVVLPSTENSVSIFDCATGELRMRVQHHQSSVRSAMLTPDGNRAVSLDQSGFVCLWETKEGRLLDRLRARYPIDESTRLAGTLESKRLILSSEKGTVCIQIDGDSLREVARWREPNFAANPKSTQVATYWSLNPLIHIRDCLTGSNLMRLELPGAPAIVQFTADGKYLVAATDELIVAIEPNTGREVFRLTGCIDSITAVGFDESFQNIITGAYDESIRFWTAKSLLEKNAWDVKSNLPIPTRDQYVATSDHIAVATGSMKETVRLYTKAKRTRSLAATGRIDSDQHDSDRALLIDDYSVKLIDAENQRKIAEVAIPYSRILNARIIPNTNDVLVLLQNQQLLRWNVIHQSLKPFGSFLNQAMSWEASPDSKSILLLGLDGTCDLYALDSETRVGSLVHSESVIRVYWPKENELFTITQDGSIHQWNVEKREEVAVFRTDGLVPNSMLLCDSGKKLIAYNDYFASKIVCWDLQSASLLWSAEGFERSRLTLNDEQTVAVITSPTKGSSLLEIEKGVVKPVSAAGATDGQFLGQTLILLELGPEQHILRHPELFTSESGEFAIRFLDYTDLKELGRMPLKSKPTKLSIDRNSSTALLTLDSWHVAICDRETHDVNLSVSFPAPIAFIRSVPNSTNWVAASVDGTCRLLDETGSVLKEFGGDIPVVVTGDVSPDGAFVALGHLNGEIRSYSLANDSESRTYRVHSGPVKQIEISDGSKAIYSIANSLFAKTDIKSGETKTHECTDGIQAFTTIKGSLEVLLLTGTDTTSMRSMSVSNDYGQLDPNTKIGSPELLNVDSMMAKQIADVLGISMDYSSETDLIAILTQDKRILVMKRSDGRIVADWRELPVDLVAIRWGKSGRLASLTNRGEVCTLNPDKKKIESQLSIGLKPATHVEAFRNQWTPIDSFQNAYAVLKPTLSLLPVDLVSFTAEHLPREFSEREREMLSVPLRTDAPKGSK